MDTNPNSHSKIISLINDDYIKMLSKEQEARSISRISQIEPSPIPKHTKGSVKKVTSKIRNFVNRNGNKKPEVNNRVLVKSNKASPVINNGQGPRTEEVTKDLENPKNQGCFKFASNSKRVVWWDPPESSIFDFCRDTSLHGLKYIGQHNRHLSERIFWLVAFFSGLVLAVVLISDVWNRYNTSPIIVSFEPTQITVDQIPFPAITICNMNKVLKEKAKEYLRRAETSSDEDAKADIYYLDHVCSATKSFSKRFNFSHGIAEKDMIKAKEILDSIKSTNDLTKVNEFLRKASQNCSDMIPLCIWQDQVIENCSTFFRPLETEFGKCCTFNMIPQSELYSLRNDNRDDENEIKIWQQWNLESATDVDGILLKNYDKPYPRRQMEAGKSNGLSVLLNPRLNDYYCTTSDSTGFRLATHWPTETPHITDYGISIRTRGEVFVNIQPQITTADTTVFKFSIDARQCYSVGEYTLRYFKYYTTRNCIDECIANATMSECNCTRYYMPRGEKQPLCGGNFECAEAVKANMTKFGAKKQCGHCLPSCSEVDYDAQTTMTPLQPGLWDFENGQQMPGLINENVSIVHIFMGTETTYARVRKELFGSTDLFANTGGLMGLCLGFSGLSLMELIYFFTLRAWFVSKRKRIEIKKKVAEKFAAAWAKVKALRYLGISREAVLDKQETENENGDNEIEKVISNYQLHVSPMYNEEYNKNIQLQNQVKKEKFNDELHKKSFDVVEEKVLDNATVNAVDYKNIF